MKFEKPNCVGVSLLTWGALVLSLMSCVASAQVPPQVDFITKDEFEAVRKMFSADKCDLRNFFSFSKSFGFKPTGRRFDDPPDEPEYQLSNLEADELCLIAMSSSFQAYRLKPRGKNGYVYPVAVGPENVFPNSVQVSEIRFYLPKALAPKTCRTFEGPSVPYTILISKKGDKLVRRIDETDAYPDCFIAVMKKKLSQGQ